MRVVCVSTTHARERERARRREEDDVAYTPICPGEKTKWLSGSGFSPYAHALLSPSAKRVPNVEQRRHTNPHGYPPPPRPPRQTQPRRSSGDSCLRFRRRFFRAASPSTLSPSTSFPVRKTWIKRRRRGGHSLFPEKRVRVSIRLSRRRRRYRRASRDVLIRTSERLVR